MKRGPIDLLLLPAGSLYMALTRLRALLFLSNLLRRKSLPAPCISVGNLTFGGTGKTPFTIHLAQKAKAMGFSPAVLTRGYGRKGSDPIQVGPGSKPVDVGDEALLMAATLEDIPVIVAARREIGAAMAPAGTDLFLLDDGFQHLRVHREVDIVLVDPTRPEELRTPPLGRLREPLSSLGRADLLALTRGGLGDLPRSVALHWAGRPRIAVRFRWEERIFPAGRETWDTLSGLPLVAFAGIAHPDALFDQARIQGLELRAALPFPDHAEPTESRKAEVRDALKQAGAGAVLCTEKDAVKWGPVWNLNVPLLYPRLRAEVEDPSGLLENLLLSLKSGEAETP